MITFEAFPKIGRLNRGITITEKIDGTNAQIIITEEGELGVASRSRLITPEKDNFGFARWVEANKEELMKLGPGRHFGEWWGPGIQRGYGMAEKRFSLFNTARWNADNPNTPKCCHVVPVLHVGEQKATTIQDVIEKLRTEGSVASPGFMRPEGIVIYHHGTRTLSKWTFEHDEGKGAAAHANDEEHS